MSTNKQRREAERRRLQQQLAERREREVARRRFTLISSIVGSLAVVALIVVIIIAATSGGDDKKTPAGASAPASRTASSSAASSPAGSASPTPGHAAAGKAVTFQGVTVKGAADLTGYPVVTSKASKPAAKLEYKDLVVGKGAAATPTSSVTVQYTGVLYADGSEFDSSWKRGQPAQFSLTGVVPGFTQGIGGTTGVPPMRIGGRRIMILPAALGYGAAGQPPTIPANATLVFVVDLLSSSAK